MKKLNEQEVFQYINDIVDALQQIEDARKQAEEALQKSNILKKKMEPLFHAAMDSLPTELKSKRKFAKLIERHNHICSEILAKEEVEA